MRTSLTLDLVLHDWRNLSPAERAQAIADVRKVTEPMPPASPHGEGRRARAINIMASFFSFLEKDA